MADNIHIRLPDGSEKEVPKGTTALEVARSISPRLADAAIAAKVGPLSGNGSEQSAGLAKPARAGAPSEGDRTTQDLIDLTRPLPDQILEITAAFEERYLRKALRRTRGHVSKCAKLTGLSRRSIADKITQYQINKDEFKKG